MSDYWRPGQTTEKRHQDPLDADNASAVAERTAEATAKISTAYAATTPHPMSRPSGSRRAATSRQRTPRWTGSRRCQTTS